MSRNFDIKTEDDGTSRTDQAGQHQMMGHVTVTEIKLVYASAEVCCTTESQSAGI